MAQPQDQLDQRAREIGRRQSLYREVNDEIDRLADRFDLLDGISLVCECGSTDCNRQIVLTQAEYERIRRIRTHFAVLPGHDLRGVERVVETNDRYVVVEKIGESAIAAIDLDRGRCSR
jgi:hypothetical protein